MGRNQLVNPDQYPDIIKAYKTYIFKTAVLLSGNQTKDRTIIQQQVDEIVDFESKLAKVSSIQKLFSFSKRIFLSCQLHKKIVEMLMFGTTK